MNELFNPPEFSQSNEWLPAGQFDEWLVSFSNLSRFPDGDDDNDYSGQLISRLVSAEFALKLWTGRAFGAMVSAFKTSALLRKALQQFSFSLLFQITCKQKFCLKNSP